MKASNKMLIGIAVALLVIPISTMVFSSLNGRVDYDEYRRGVAIESVKLDTEDKFLTTTKLEEFNDVKISSDDYSYLHVHLVKSDEYGVKINRTTHGELSYEIDEEGTLHISVPEVGSYYPTIFLFAPNIHHVEFDRVHIGALHTEQDSLSLFFNRMHPNETVIEENPNLAFLHLNLNNSDWTMRGSSPMFEQLKSIEVELEDSSISLESDYYNEILIHANNSSFKIDPAKDSQAKIGRLTVNTLGKSTISLEERVRVDSLSGSISDSTLVKAPFYMMEELVRR